MGKANKSQRTKVKKILLKWGILQKIQIFILCFGK